MKTARLMTLCGALAMMLATAAFAQPVKRVRYPGISPDGKTIAFTYQSDLWTVSSKGGRATRLTIHPARDIQPVFTPDGKSILFASNRYGNYDLFLMPATGGKPRRLTYNSSSEFPSGFMPDGKTILFYSGAYGSSDIFRMPVAGGEPIRLTWDWRSRKYFGQVSPDGSRIAFDLNGSPGNWRRRGYQGSFQSDIWTAAFDTPLRDLKQLTHNLGSDFFPMWSQDGKRIYYVSDRKGNVNIWRMNRDGGEKTQITNHQGDGVRVPSYAPKAQKMVYEYDSSIYLLNTRNKKTAPVTIDIETDDPRNLVSERTYTTRFTEFDTSPDGKKIALVVRGELFVLPASGGKGRNLSRQPSRESHILWTKDSQHVIFVTDREGTKDLHVVNIHTGKERTLTSGPADDTNPVLSPDGKTVAFHRGDHEICTIPLAGGEVTVAAHGNFLDVTRGYTPSFSWSPDGKWLVYKNRNDRLYDSIWVQEIGKGEAHRVSPFYQHTHRPRFSSDNTLIYYRGNALDNDRLYVVNLRPEKPVKFDEDKLEALDKKSGKAKPKPDGKLHINFDTVLDHVEAVTPASVNVGEARYVSSGDRFLYASQAGLFAVSADARNSAGSRLGPPVAGFQVRGRTLFAISPTGQLQRISLTTRAATTIKWSAVVRTNLVAENQQIFDEIWWLMDRYYYDPGHSGTDWKPLKAKYQKLLPYTTAKSDFYELMLEMVLEIKGSHLGVAGPSDYSASLPASTAFLGIEPDWRELQDSGRFKVASVLPHSPADQASSKLKAGEYLLAINGVELSPENTFAKLLDRQSGKKVVLLVNDKPDKEGAREVAIKPLSAGAAGGLRYRDWVEERRRLTDKLSGGRVAYLHIQAMNGSSERLFKEQLVSLAAEKDGLIVDVRFNGGGNVAHHLLDILRKRPYVAFQPRSLGKKVPADWFGGYMWARPAALLINQTSASNSEMMALGFKQLDVGPVVGVPTMGAVIATGSWQLMDGGRLRMPSAGVYAASGEDLQGKGREPDLLVPYDPIAAQAGRDPQLEAAVKLVLKQMADKSLGRKDLKKLISSIQTPKVAAKAGAAKAPGAPAVRRKKGARKASRGAGGGSQ